MFPFKHDKNCLYEFCKSCSKDRHCCFRASTIVVLPDEASRIIERTGRKDYLLDESDGLLTILKLRDRCPFLTAERLCGIYDIRPIDCRSWPITLSLCPELSKDIKYIIDMGCPAAQQNALSNEFISAAKQILGKIDLSIRLNFIKLVYRDQYSLPLFPFLSRSIEE